MFYCTELLVRKRPFGSVWLAAMLYKKNSVHPLFPTMEEILRVIIHKTCEDIEQQQPGLSLYLSSHLMFGTAVILKYQQKYLIAELTQLLLGRPTRGETDITAPTPSPSRRSKKAISIPDPISSGNSPSWNRSTANKDLAIPEVAVWPMNINEGFTDIQYPPGHLESPFDEITLPSVAAIHRHSLHVDDGDLDLPAMPSFASSFSTGNTSTLLPPESPIRPDPRTPAQPPRPSEQPPRPHKPSVPPEPEESPERPVEGKPEESGSDTVSYPVPSNSSLERSDITLPELSAEQIAEARRRRGHGRRRRRLVVDAVMQLDHDKTRRNRNNTAAIVRCHSPIAKRDRAETWTSVDSYFTRPGMPGMLSRPMRAFWNNIVNAGGQRRVSVSSRSTPSRSSIATLSPRAASSPRTPDGRNAPPTSPHPPTDMPDDFLPEDHSHSIEAERDRSTVREAENISASRIRSPASSEKSGSSASTPRGFQDVSSSGNVSGDIVDPGDPSSHASSQLSPIEEMDEMAAEIRVQSGGSLATTFYAICPPGSRSRLVAGHKFNILLFGTSMGRFEVEQVAPYDDINILLVR